MNALTQPTALDQARQLLESTRRVLQKSDDPYVISRFGDWQIRVEVAAALLEYAETHPARCRRPSKSRCAGSTSLSATTTSTVSPPGGLLDVP